MYKRKARALLRPAWIEISLDNLEQNLKAVKRRIGDACAIIGIVKSDAYGHGAIECGKVMLQNGASHLAVATLEEALELRDAGLSAPILMLGIVPNQYMETLVENDIIPIISDLDNAKAFSEAAIKGCKTLPVFIAADTGMGRIGFPITSEAADTVRDISRLPNVRLEGMLSHFSSADMEELSYSYWQIENFNEFSRLLEQRDVHVPIRTLSNSPAMYRLPESYYDAVRPGAMLWGFYPDNITNRECMAMLPVMSVKARVVYVKSVPADTAVSYGRKFVTKRESRIATLPLGYADGLTRMLQGDQIRVLLRGQYAPILGTICMDQCMVDVTDIPGVSVDDEAVILGTQNGKSIDVKELCDISGLCSGELLYHFSNRLPRVFHYHGEEYC